MRNITIVIELDGGAKYARTLPGNPRDATDLEIEAYLLACSVGSDPGEVVRHGFALCGTHAALSTPGAVRWAR